jgi:hypothetical protein
MRWPPRDHFHLSINQPLLPHWFRPWIDQWPLDVGSAIRLTARGPSSAVLDDEACFCHRKLCATAASANGRQLSHVLTDGKTTRHILLVSNGSARIHNGLSVAHQWS